jgi:PAS domain S-box-containing protein
VWISGVDGKCNWFNQGWMQFTGRTLAQEVGDGWLDGVHPDDRDHCLRTYVDAFSARQPFAMDYRLRRHDGEYRWLHDQGRPRFDTQKAFAGYIGSCMDITQRRETEETLRRSEDRYRHLLDELDCGYALHELVTDALGKTTDFRFVAVNRTFGDLTGLRARDVVGKRFLEVFHEDAPTWIEPFAAVVATGQATEHDVFIKTLGKHFHVKAFRPEPGRFAVLIQPIVPPAAPQGTVP